MQLNRADVVTGALTLLDAEGLDGLTMRKLGAHLGVQAGAVYWHFTNKQALLEAMADRIVESVGDEPFPPAPWDAQLSDMAQRLRRALLSRRDGARVVAGTYVIEPNTVRSGQQALRILTGAGIPADRAPWILFPLFHYVLGHTIEEQAQRAEGDWENRNAGLPDDELNHAMTAMISADPADRFTYGLELFLDGLRHRHQEGPA
ncbi:TetR/AcrR family tetracycline transcriptional repressor [Actinoplanes lutulentus]|uniref:TetR family transcriptional regulator n=1 Tax=Actinoplanes lutulentus TaxID=1287878 RepID=A0A327YZ05_9ACTN|nr:TetR/AcrR family transcriptional regulator C-terminal domain-containing protein [Actinoplanes lutulentus]MBB2948993.1 TetR/AcrR family tetracycline transcriptional repressor [Actinoplanes lutulentus]RAK26228.1 TetR family transcriptional regulator [Actinoplanes lutulentus]